MEQISTGTPESASQSRRTARRSRPGTRGTSAANPGRRSTCQQSLSGLRRVVEHEPLPGCTTGSRGVVATNAPGCAELSRDRVGKLSYLPGGRYRAPCGRTCSRSGYPSGDSSVDYCFDLGQGSA